MNSKPSPVSKRLRADTWTGDECTDDIAGSSSDGSEVTKDNSKTFVNVFTDDILPEILDNLDILTAKDLLTFRLVNRCWRVAATSVLLKRNLCQIAVSFGKLATGEDGKAVGERVDNLLYERIKERLSNSVASYTYFSANKPSNFLTDLTQLISTSPKFPSTSIRFRSDCDWRNLHPPSDWPHAFPYQADLLHFFSLYGKEIRKLSLSDRISRELLQDLLYVHMPHLISLDFKNWFDFSSQILAMESSEVQVCRPSPSILQIKEIFVGTDEAFTLKKGVFMKELINVCPNLGAIHNVGEAALGVLLDEGKSHLIQDLTFGPGFRQVHTIRKFTKLLTETILESRLPKLKLKKFKVQLANSRRYGFVWKAINVILCASKNSLKSLELDLSPARDHFRYFVPPLPHLECLELTDLWIESTTRHRINFLGDIIGRAIHSGELTVDKDVGDEDFEALVLQNQGSKNIPADYFPRLRKVKLVAGETTNEFNQLLEIFSLEHLGPDGVTTVAGDTLLTVTTLELSKFPSHDGNMSKLFPNVSHLSIFCNSSCHLRNWVWTAFSKLERFEMSINNIDWNAEKVDHFFTGISQESYANFGSEANSSKLDSDPVKDFERTQPFIGDCDNLKEFKIKFRGKFGSQFASKVTAVHGFQKVIHRTKIIFSFESPKMSVEEMQEILRNLDPVAAYVEIQMKK